MSDEIWAEPDRRCLRGLATVIHFPPRLTAQLEDALRTLLAPAVEGEELWGERRVKRFLLQFVVEARLGERDGQVSLHHRQRVPPEDRRRREEQVVTLLRALVAATSGADTTEAAPAT